MNYKVLYRKYRPDSFENLVGQDNIVKIIKNSIIKNKIAHAYIFSGPRGTGKTSSAKIFAKNINCLHNENGVACGECINCKEIEKTSDIIEIDAASNNGVDEIREIVNNIKLVPSMMKYKVYIIDEVHMLSTSAFNALLLTLEEPPSHVVFILATTNIESVPITILSRCQRFDFKKITNDNIVHKLNEICKLEKINIDDKALELIAKISDGGLRDSLSLLDQLSKENEYITEEIVSNYSGNISVYIVQKIIELLDTNEIKELNSILEDVFTKGIDYKILIKYIVKEISNVVQKKMLTNYSTRLTIEQYKKLILDLTDFQNKINVNVETHAILTVILFSYINYDEIKICTNSIEKKENKEDNIKKLETTIISKNNTNNEKKLRDLRINNCFAKADKELKENMLVIWEKYLKDMDNVLKGSLIDSNISVCSNDIIIINFHRKNDLEEVLNNYENFSKDFFKKTKIKQKLILIDTEYWNELVIKYKKDKKSGIIYTVKDESKYLKDNKIDVTDIFDKVEEI